jgi:hypothetical protein
VFLLTYKYHALIKHNYLKKHRALGQLASTTAGTYNSNGLLGGVILKVKLGGYLNNEYAILNNITYDIPNDASWDIDTMTNNPPDKKANTRAQLSMYINASVNLTIIHKDRPQYKQEGWIFWNIYPMLQEGFLNKDYKKDYAAARVFPLPR